jgi:type I restriction enzyme S subunit
MEISNSYNKTLLKKGDLVMALRGKIGELSIISKTLEGANLTRGVALIAVKPKYLNKYIRYQINSPALKRLLENRLNGSALKELSLGVLRKVPIIIPPTLEEQTAIATVLSDTDELISSLERLIAKKQAIKQGAMQELLKYKEGWVTKKLGEVCDVRDGTHDSPKYFDKGVKFVTSKNIINGKLDFSDISYISNEDAALVNQRSKVDKGDILMSMIGTIGNAVLVDFTPDFCIKNVALLKPKKINSLFLLQLIYSSSFQKYIESKLAGGIQKFISLGVLRDLDVPFSPIDEQTRIATILSSMDSEIEALNTKLQKLKSIKQGMMQELLTGKTRLTKQTA